MNLTWSTFKTMNTPTAWRARFMRNKWILAWTGAVSLFGYMVYVAVAQADKPWQGAVLQTMGTAIPIYAAILIYLQSKAAGDKAMREQIDNLQRLNQLEIEAMTALFQKQMDHLSDQTSKQIAEYGRETLKVVHKLEEHSSLLAALMKRELEKAIANHNANVNEAMRQMRKIQSFQVGRTEAEKAQQVAAYQAHLDRLHDWGMYIQDRHRQLTIEHNPRY